GGRRGAGGGGGRRRRRPPRPRPSERRARGDRRLRRRGSSRESAGGSPGGRPRRRVAASPDDVGRAVRAGAGDREGDRPAGPDGGGAADAGVERRRARRQDGDAGDSRKPVRREAIAPSWPEMALVDRIARAHGLRGQVIVNLETDFPEERFQPGAELFVERGGRIEPLTITTV